MRISRMAGIAAATTALVAAAAVPAAADTTASTTTTFAVTAAELAITAPTTATLPDAAPGGSTSGALGTVSVTDGRAALDASWVATATLDAPFTTGTGTTPETIPAANVTYDPGAAIDPTPPEEFTPGSPGTLDSPVTAMSHTTGSGVNSVSWNPTLTIAVPSGAVAGTYTGTVVHSVA